MDLAELLRNLHNIGDLFNINQIVPVLVNDKKIVDIKLVDNEILLILEND